MREVEMSLRELEEWRLKGDDFRSYAFDSISPGWPRFEAYANQFGAEPEKALIYGVGETAQEALHNLCEQLKL